MVKVGVYPSDKPVDVVLEFVMVELNAVRVESVNENVVNFEILKSHEALSFVPTSFKLELDEPLEGNQWELNVIELFVVQNDFPCDGQALVKVIATLNID